MAKYGKKTQSTVKKAMRKFKEGELHSGKSGKTVKSRKQAVAIGLSEARAKGEKAPAAPKKAAKRKVAAKRTVKRAVKRTTTRRKTSRK